MENNDKRFYLKVRGQEIEVSEKVYRAYIRPIRAEQRRKRREWKCQKLSETGGYYVRCKERCENCPYYLAGNSALGNVTSLDKLVDCEVEIEDSTVYGSYIYRASIKDGIIDGYIEREQSLWKRMHIILRILCCILSEILIFVWIIGRLVLFFRSINLPKRLEKSMYNNGFIKLGEMT